MQRRVPWVYVDELATQFRGMGIEDQQSKGAMIIVRKK